MTSELLPLGGNIKPIVRFDSTIGVLSERAFGRCVDLHTRPDFAQKWQESNSLKNAPVSSTLCETCIMRPDEQESMDQLHDVCYRIVADSRLGCLWQNVIILFSQNALLRSLVAHHGRR